MTYCVAIRIEEGMIFASDTRTNAGIDNISTFRKMFQYSIEGERVLVLQTAGNLATSQAVFNKLQYAIDQGWERTLHTAPTLFDAAQLVGECLREETVRAQNIAQNNNSHSFTSTFLLGGQIKGQAPEVFMIYSEGNCIQTTYDTPFFQLGESKYGKPILDRSVTYHASMQEALRATLISFDSTLRSNLSVGLPIDLIIYRNDTLTVPKGHRITERDEYFQLLREKWSEGLRQILLSFPHSPNEYWE